MKASLLVVVMVLVLAGCATPAEQAADDDICTGYGFNPQTMPADYAVCRIHVERARQDQDNMTGAALFVGRPQ